LFPMRRIRGCRGILVLKPAPNGRLACFCPTSALHLELVCCPTGRPARSTQQPGPALCRALAPSPRIAPGNAQQGTMCSLRPAHCARVVQDPTVTTFCGSIYAVSLRSPSCRRSLWRRWSPRAWRWRPRQSPGRTSRCGRRASAARALPFCARPPHPRAGAQRPFPTPLAPPQLPAPGPFSKRAAPAGQTRRAPQGRRRLRPLDGFRSRSRRGAQAGATAPPPPPPPPSL